MKGLLKLEKAAVKGRLKHSEIPMVAGSPATKDCFDRP
jgi:hypothetical protein